jgi:hypothetical protein
MPTELSNPGDWFAIGCVFSGPFWFDDKTSGTECSQKYGANVGVQTLVVMDVGSDKFLHGEPIPKVPDYLTADEVCGVLGKVFQTTGMPRIGVVIGSSVCQSSHELLLNEETRPRGEWLQKLEIEIPPMPALEKDQIRLRLTSLGLQVSFD